MGNKFKNEDDRYMVAEDWASFIKEEKNPLFSLLWRLILGCGLRIQEALMLNIEDVEFKKKVLSVRTLKRNKKVKGKLEREYPRFDKDLSEEILAELKNLKREEGQLIFDIPYLKAWRHFKRIALKANLSNRLSPHSLRHLYGLTIAQANNGNVIEIAKALRQASTDSAMFYVHLNPERRKELSKGVWDKLNI